jgi:hypothetical protein
MRLREGLLPAEYAAKYPKKKKKKNQKIEPAPAQRSRQTKDTGSIYREQEAAGQLNLLRGRLFARCK